MVVSECLQMLVLFLGQRCYGINKIPEGIDGAGGVQSARKSNWKSHRKSVEVDQLD